MYKLIVTLLLLSSVCYGIEPVTTAAAASAISPWALAGASALGAGLTSAFNWFSARKSEDFSERMANTAHQREITDLKAAGLNPILSAGGKGAPSPSGNQANAGNLDLLASAMAHAQIRKTNSEADLIAVNADRERDAWAIDASMEPERLMYRRSLMLQAAENRQLTEAQRNSILAGIPLINKQIELTSAQTASTAQESRIRKAEAEKSEVLKKPYEWINKGIEKLPSWDEANDYLWNRK